MSIDNKSSRSCARVNVKVVYEKSNGFKKSPLTKRKILTRKGAKHREIDICAQMKAVGRHTSRAVLGFCHFTGTDWGGKFVGLSKKTWMTVFLSLDDNDPIVEKISLLGEGPTSMSTDR